MSDDEYSDDEFEDEEDNEASGGEADKVKVYTHTKNMNRRTHNDELLISRG